MQINQLESVITAFREERAELKKDEELSHLVKRLHLPDVSEAKVFPSDKRFEELTRFTHHRSGFPCQLPL